MDLMKGTEQKVITVVRYGLPTGYITFVLYRAHTFTVPTLKSYM